MNSRSLALLALSCLFAGCTQVSILPSDTQDSSESQPPEETTLVSPDFNEQPDGQELPLIDSEAVIASSQDESLLEAEDEPSETEITEEKSIEPEIAMDLAQNEFQQNSINAMCREIGNKLGSVSVEDCLAQPLKFAGSYTVQSRPMVVRDFLPVVNGEVNEAGNEEKEIPRVLILGGIHGDEYSSISIMFKWMELIEQNGNQDFLLRFAPTVNPDGLLDGQAIRQNANGVDLNRNFPSEDWLNQAEEYWTNTTNRNPRRYPGTHPASEPEVQWVVDQINSFKPDVIVSVHAPYHLLDYDGPPEPPQRIGELHLHLLGVYPGSLGNYAGINLGIPVVTMELPSAGIMPSNDEIVSMWEDLQNWLYEHHDS